MIEQGKETPEAENSFFCHPLFLSNLGVEKLCNVIFNLQTFLLVFKELNLVELEALVRILKKRTHLVY